MKKVLIFLVMLLPATAWADGWKLDPTDSDINVVSVKKGTVAEVHHFTRLYGDLRGDQAEVSIDLTSIETGVAVRNARMQSLLFEVSRFAAATIRADVRRVKWKKLHVGEVVMATVPLTVRLHGVMQNMQADVLLTVLKGGDLLVSSRSPVIVRAADFKLSSGIEALRKVAGLPSIAMAVPVYFHLHFTH